MLPDITTPNGCRDKAMLELLYASGLRVSELIGLHLGDISFEMAYVRCFGKGAKERVIPLGRYALAALEHYIQNCRRQSSQQLADRYFVFEQKRKRFDPAGFLEADKKIWARSRYYCRFNTPCTAGIPLPPICYPMALICGPFRKCWDMPILPPHRFIPICWDNKCWMSIRQPIRGLRRLRSRWMFWN